MKMPKVAEVEFFLIEDGHKRYLCGNWNKNTYKVRVPLQEYYKIESREMDNAVPFVDQIMLKIRFGKVEKEKIDPQGKGWGQV